MDRRIFGIENEYGVTCTFEGQRRLSARTRSPATCSAAWCPGAAPATSSCATVPGSTSTSARTPSTRRRSATTCARSSSTTRRGSASSRAWSRTPQQRLQDEGIAGEVYLFKNNTDSAGNSYGCHENYLVSPARRLPAAVRRPDPVPGQPADHLRRGQGAADPARRRLLRQPAGRPHLGGRLERHDPVPADHQHPRRAARRRRALPAAARHRRRLQHERDDDAAQGRLDRPRAADDRGRRRSCATSRWRTRSGRSARSATT